MQRIKKEHLKKTTAPPSDQIGLGNILGVFSRIEDIARLLSALLPQMQRLIELIENTGQVCGKPLAKGQSELGEKMAELLSLAKQTREDSGFVKMVFTQEKPKKTKKQAGSSIAVNEYLHKYNRSMKR